MIKVEKKKKHKETKVKVEAEEVKLETHQTYKEAVTKDNEDEEKITMKREIESLQKDVAMLQTQIQNILKAFVDAAIN